MAPRERTRTQNPGAAAGGVAPRITTGFSGWAWWRLRPVNDNKPPLSVVLAAAALIALAVVALAFALARWAF